MHIHIGVGWLFSGSILKVLVFFAVPAWLSAVRLFYFGTYLTPSDPGWRTRG